MLIVLAAAGIVFAGLLAWFYALESGNRRHTIFLVLVAVMLVEALIAGQAAHVPTGILRPRFGGQDFRPPDLIIFAALAARLLAWRPRPITAVGAAWSAFLVVYVTGAIIGVLNNLPMGNVLYQGKDAFYLTGGIVVAAGADLRKTFDSVGTLGLVLAPIVPLALIIRMAHIKLSVNTPIQDLRGLGMLSNDTISVLVLIGAMVVVTEACHDRPRAAVVVAGGVLLMAPITGEQRASYLVLGLAVGVLTMLYIGQTWRRRTSITGTEVLLGCGALLALVIVGFLITASPGVIVDQVQGAFGGANEERTTEARVSLYHEATTKIGESPVIGNGVGTMLETTIVSTQKSKPAAAHNVILDMTLRVGLVGLAFFVLALAVTTWAGVAIWRSDEGNPAASVAVSCVIIMLGVVTKAMVEPALDKFRLSLLCALAIGGVVAAVHGHDESDQRDRTHSVHPMAAS